MLWLSRSLTHRQTGRKTKSELDWREAVVPKNYRQATKLTKTSLGKSRKRSRKTKLPTRIKLGEHRQDCKKMPGQETWGVCTTKWYIVIIYVGVFKHLLFDTYSSIHAYSDGSEHSVSCPRIFDMWRGGGWNPASTMSDKILFTYTHIHIYTYLYFCTQYCS